MCSCYFSILKEAEWQFKGRRSRLDSIGLFSAEDVAQDFILRQIEAGPSLGSMPWRSRFRRYMIDRIREADSIKNGISRNTLTHAELARDKSHGDSSRVATDRQIDAVLYQNIRRLRDEACPA